MGGKKANFFGGKKLWIPPTHLYSSVPGGYAVQNDGTYDWVTDIYDQIGSNDLSQPTNAYRNRIESGGFYQNKPLFGRINYDLSATLNLQLALGYTLIVVGQVAYSGTGRAFWAYKEATFEETLIFYESNDGNGFKIYGDLNEVPVVPEMDSNISIGVVNQNKGFLYNSYNGTNSTTWSNPKDLVINGFFGLPDTGGGVGNFRYPQGYLYEISVYKDQFLSDDEINNLILFYRKKYNA